MPNDSTSILLAAGKQSDGSLHDVDLTTEANLFVSWSREEQIDEVLQFWILRLTEVQQLPELVISVTRKRAAILPLQRFTFSWQFIRYEEEATLQKTTIDGFVKDLFLKYKKRQKQRELYSTKNILQKPIIILIDNIFQLLNYRRKQTGDKLLMLLSDGRYYGMHFIIGSPVSYRNLMVQIQASAAKVNTNDPQRLRPGAELVLTDDNLYFYRSSSEMNYTRLFPVI